MKKSITVDGIIYTSTGLTENPDVDIMVQLAIAGYSYRKIGEIFNCSHQNIAYHFKTQDMLEYIGSMKALIFSDKLDKVKEIIETTNLSDGEVSKLASIPIHYVYGCRRKILLRYQQRNVNPYNRLKALCFSLFGNNYIPGPEFSNYISKKIEKMKTDRKKEAMHSFYVDFNETKDGYSRLLRFMSKDDLDIVESPDNLLKEFILCRRK